MQQQHWIKTTSTCHCIRQRLLRNNANRHNRGNTKTLDITNQGEHIRITMMRFTQLDTYNNKNNNNNHNKKQTILYMIYAFLSLFIAFTTDSFLLCKRRMISILQCWMMMIPGSFQLFVDFFFLYFLSYFSHRRIFFKSFLILKRSYFIRLRLFSHLFLFCRHFLHKYNYEFHRSLSL